MSIQTELTRITNAKAAIKTAIEGKGVTVPDGTLLDGMAALIETIEAGGGGSGGLPSPFTNITTGTFTLTEIAFCDEYRITHGLGKAPTIFVIYNDVSGRYSDLSISYIAYINHSNTGTTAVGAMCDCKVSVQYAALKRTDFIVNENTFEYNDSNSYYGAGRQFRWVAIA